MQSSFQVSLFLTSVAALGCDPLGLLKEAAGSSSSAAASSAAPAAPPASVVPAPPGPAPIPTAAGAVSIGTSVKAAGAGGPVAGKVVEFYGKLGKLELGSGNKEWVQLSKMTPAGTALPDPQGDACSVLVGQRVKAPWPYEDKKYLARVGEVYGKMARVVYQDDGNLAWVACEDCDPAF